MHLFSDSFYSLHKLSFSVTKISRICLVGWSEHLALDESERTLSVHSCLFSNKSHFLLVNVVRVCVCVCFNTFCLTSVIGWGRGDLLDMK